jgi:hypothetical protein
MSKKFDWQKRRAKKIEEKCAMLRVLTSNINEYIAAGSEKIENQEAALSFKERAEANLNEVRPHIGTPTAERVWVVHLLNWLNECKHEEPPEIAYDLMMNLFIEPYALMEKNNEVEQTAKDNRPLNLILESRKERAKTYVARLMEELAEMKMHDVFLPHYELWDDLAAGILVAGVAEYSKWRYRDVAKIIYKGLNSPDMEIAQKARGEMKRFIRNVT